MCDEISARAIMAVRQMGSRTHTQLMLLENKQLAVVKLRSPEKCKRLLSGCVATRLARKLGVPTPKAVVVEIPQFIFGDLPAIALAEETSPPRENACRFGSLLAGNPVGKTLMDFLPSEYLRSLSNRDCFLAALAVDKWTSFCGSPKVVFHRPPGNSGYCAEFINRSNAFCGPDLDFRDSPLNGIYHGRTVYSEVTGWDSFEPFLSHLVTTTPETLWELTRDLPFGWSSQYADRLDALVSALLKRRSRIRDLIKRSRDESPSLFPAWTKRLFVSPGRLAQTTTMKDHKPITTVGLQL